MQVGKGKDEPLTLDPSGTGLGAGVKVGIPTAFGDEAALQVQHMLHPHLAAVPHVIQHGLGVVGLLGEDVVHKH